MTVPWGTPLQWLGGGDPQRDRVKAPLTPPASQTGLCLLTGSPWQQAGLPKSEYKCVSPPSVHISAWGDMDLTARGGGSRRMRGSDLPTVTRCRSLPWVPHLGVPPAPKAARQQHPKEPHRSREPSHPPPPPAAPAVPLTTPFLFPFPARLVSSSPRQLATPRAALGRRPEGLDLLQLVSVQLAPPCR